MIRWTKGYRLMTKLFLSEYDHVANQMKVNEAYSNLSHIKSLKTGSVPGLDQKVKFCFFAECSHIAY